MSGCTRTRRLIGVGLVAALCAPVQPPVHTTAITALLAAGALSRQVHVDLDGDRVPDSGIIISATQIRLSFARSGHDELLSTPQTLVGLVAADVNRDGAFDLVASLSDGSLIVWLNDGHGRLDRVHPRSAPLGPALTTSTRLHGGVTFVLAAIFRDGVLGECSEPGELGQATGTASPVVARTPFTRPFSRSDRAPPRSRL